MSDSDEIRVFWLDEVKEGNYTSAQSYLSLIYPVAEVAKIVASLRAAELTAFKAKDIFRASQLSLLGVSNLRVEKDRRKIANGTALSPILLLRDTVHGKVVIADGYHRLCAIYSLDEDVDIECKIV